MPANPATASPGAAPNTSPGPASASRTGMGTASPAGGRSGSMTESSAERVVVVVLTYNQREVTLRCLASLRELGGPSFDVVVWDNGSTDGTAEALRLAYPE